MTDDTDPSRKSRATIADVARRAGVSAGTVSHVLSGEAKVSPRLRERVLNAIQDLNYTPNFHAQRLRKTKSNLLALCLPHSFSIYSATLSALFDGLARERGFSLLQLRSQPETELQRVQEVCSLNVAGLLLFPNTVPEETLDFLAAVQAPTVLIDRSNDDLRFDQVILNNRMAISDVASRLVAMGHARFLLICRSRQNLTTRHRILGFNDVAARTDAPFEVRYIEFHDDTEILEMRLADELRGVQAPTTIICSAGQQAAATIPMLKALGMTVPGDVSLITFDDPEWSELVQPSLSVIRQPANEVAERAWSLLMDRIDDPDRAPQAVELEAEFVARGSIGNAPTSAQVRKSAAARKRRAPPARTPAQ